MVSIAGGICRRPNYICLTRDIVNDEYYMLRNLEYDDEAFCIPLDLTTCEIGGEVNLMADAMTDMNNLSVTVCDSESRVVDYVYYSLELMFGKVEDDVKEAALMMDSDPYGYEDGTVVFDMKRMFMDLWAM